MLTKEVASQMVEQTMIRLERNINIMDLDGLIFASGEPIRLHQLHAGAAHVAKTGETLVIEETETSQWPGSKAGINLPLKFKDKLVAVIGITGSPKDLEAVAPLVQLTCELLLHQAIVTSEAEWKRKWKDDAVTELMMTGQLSESTIERAAMSHFSFSPPLICSVFESTGEQTNTLRRKIEDFFDWSDQIVGIGLNNELVLITSRLEEKSLEAKLTRLQHVAPFQKVAIGKTVYSTSELSLSLTTANVTLSKQQSLIDTFTQYELHYLLAQVPSHDRYNYAKSLVGTLDDKACLTLLHLMKHNLSLQDTADSLGIHRHTLTYRIKQIQEKTGLHPLIFQDAVRLWLALEWQKAETT